jgi:hypothetical protein
MLDRPSDDEISRQILGVLMRYRIAASGTLQRNYFFEIRDTDFQRGINKAVANNWITIDPHNTLMFLADCMARARPGEWTSGVSVDKMIDAVQPNKPDDDKIKGNDVVQQSRHNQDQDACDKGNDR